jgi:1-acyl-sn-glycerol-3-phosphate acyltransferase
MNSTSPKPQSEIYRPELTRLPRLTLKRRLFRRLLQAAAWLVVRICTRLEVVGRENIPKKGPVILVSNHLGDADVLVGLAVSPFPYDVLGKVELYDHPIAGRLMEPYGTIWVHRGQPDRRAIQAALDGLAEGRMIAIAPEGRESLDGTLEEGTGGAVFLALKANVPILPVALTGTENWRLYGNLKRLRRTRVTFTIGEQFKLVELGSRRDSIDAGTQKLMLTLARMLPPEYQGAYRHIVENENGSQ